MVPDSLMRFIFWVLTRSLYRVRVIGRENIPEKGGALFVANHVSFVDSMLLIASTDRYIRFLMDKDFFELPFIKPFARMLRVIPISGRQNLRDLILSLREASSSIQHGDVVCIFAEGQMTRIGQMLPFRKGFERIMKHVDAPIVPVHLDGIWESLFSYHKGRFFFKWPSAPLRPVTVTFGKPLSSKATAVEVRRAIQDLGTVGFSLRKSEQHLLHRAFLRTARRHPWRFAAADGNNPKVTFFGLLFRAIFLGWILKKHWREEKMVGLLIPPSIAGHAANVAATLAGKVSVNLNYTVSQEILESCIRQCEIRVTLASRQLLEKVKLQPPGKVIYLEDLAAYRTRARLAAAMLAALFAPTRLLERWLGSPRKRSIEDLVTVIFSSGSTGDPKGIMLSHHNLFSNLEGIAQVFAVNHRDRIMGILPFFHSFGYTVTLWFPAIIGFGAIYHPNPLDARTIGKLAFQYKVTVLVATPTLLQGYTRRCFPEDFGSLHLVVTGAEKLNERIANSFEEKFGVRPLEGYGCTECAPIVAVNMKDFRAPGFYQIGHKRGRIGHPLPGIAVRIVDPDTMQPLPPNTPGMLLVKGPNVMMGYLKNPEMTAQVFHDNYYITGDLAKVDADGFITITDRLSRFSKIGGEMVPHMKVEEALHQLAGAEELMFAVAGVPDEKKGEKLVVLHSLSPEEKLRSLVNRLAQTSLPPLWLPRPNCFYRVEQIPVLGTGKLDLRAIKELALKLSATEFAPQPVQP
jgi:acyl-[acyl-carrier-protein]-phospholipid O-acyltransferase/long-chain-fatty-acid--[acyl-carrier-protein] ligase